MALPPSQRPFNLTASDVTLMAELRSSAGLSTVGTAEFSKLAMGALLHAACEAAVPSGASAADVEAAEAAKARAAAGDRSTPIHLHAFHAALGEIVPTSHSLAPARQREMSLALTTLFLIAEQYAWGGGEEGEEGGGAAGGGGSPGKEASARGIPAAELVTALFFLCDGTKTEKLSEAFKLCDVDGDGFLTLPQTESMLRGALANLAAVRSRAHLDAETPSETAAMDHLADSVKHLAARVMREAARGQGGGRLTFQGLCEWYNSGGYNHLGFLELLDWKKLVQLCPPQK